MGSEGIDRNGCEGLKELKSPGPERELRQQFYPVFKAVAEIEGGLRMDDRNQGYECPKCENEEIEQGQKYCQICGKPLEWKEADDLPMLLQG